MIDLLRPSDRWLKARSQPFLVSLSAASLLFVFIVDYLTPTELHLTIFYLIPVSLAAWYVGRRVGLAMALVSAMAWHYADSLNRTALLSVWNVMVVYGIFAANAFSVAKLKADRERQGRLQNELRQARVQIDALSAHRTLCEKCGKALGGVNGDGGPSAP